MIAYQSILESIVVQETAYRKIREHIGKIRNVCSISHHLIKSYILSKAYRSISEHIRAYHKMYVAYRYSAICVLQKIR